MKTSERLFTIAQQAKTLDGSYEIVGLSLDNMLRVDV